MQISRHVLLACAIATCLTPTLLHAFDNEAQIRARQALEEKMNQMETQTSPATSSPPAVVKKPAKKSAPPAVVTKPTPPAEYSAPPVAKPTTPVVTMPPAAPAVETPPAQPAPTFAPEISQPATPAPVTPSASMSAPPMEPAPATPAYNSTPATSANSSHNDQLQQALHQKMSETAAPEVATEPPAKPVKPAKPMKPAPAPMKENHVAATPAPAPVSQPAPAPASAPEYSPVPSPSTTPRPTLSPALKTPTAIPTQPSLSLPQLAAPPSSLSAAKQQKLDELLQQYRADQLSPQQYHEQRAKVLSEP
jgi:hypothetical protein